MNEDDLQLLDAAAVQCGRRNGVPTDAEREQRRRAFAEITAALGPWLEPPDIAVSPLGVEWTARFRATMRHRPNVEMLRDRGWLPLDRLLDRRVGSHRRWAVVSDGEVIGAVQLEKAEIDQVQDVLARATERREVTVRDVLELRELRRRGRTFPTWTPVLQLAAEVETSLGGRHLSSWASGRAVPPPAALPRPNLPSTRRGLVIACSGVDGSGKSSMADQLAQEMATADIAVSRIWLRPGMGLGRLGSLAGQVKRLLRHDPEPGIRAVARGDAPAVPSRAGVLGWTWALLVTLSFLVSVRRRHAAAHGVVLYDRHLLDALATIDFGYPGRGRGIHRYLVRSMLPPADITFYLSVPAEVAVSRKPGDPLGQHAVQVQLAAYEREIRKVRRLVRLDGTRPVTDLVSEALRSMTNW